MRKGEARRSPLAEAGRRLRRHRPIDTGSLTPVSAPVSREVVSLPRGIVVDEAPRGVLASAARGGELVVGAAIVLVHLALKTRYDRTPPS
jgi:hypothetical protein